MLCRIWRCWNGYRKPVSVWGSGFNMLVACIGMPDNRGGWPGDQPPPIKQISVVAPKKCWGSLNKDILQYFIFGFYSLELSLIKILTTDTSVMRNEIVPVSCEAACSFPAELFRKQKDNSETPYAEN